MRCIAVGLFFTAACAVALLCRAGEDGASDRAWRASVDVWKEQRLQSIAGEDGWITLVGRLWLHAGENRLGSDAKSDLPLPKDRAPAYAGSLFLSADPSADRSVRLEVAPGVALLSDGKRTATRAIVDDRDGTPTRMTLGSLTMFVIKRQDRYALRVKDRAHPARKTFRGLVYYPLDARLHVRARLDPAPKGKTIPVVNVLGQTEQMPTPGALRFSLDGVAYALDAVIEAGETDLFILFRDETAGEGTYPSGRFLYAPPPGPGGTVDLDFNRAYTPPCGFTKFATCPIPPPQNHLARKIEAGERYAGAHAE